MSIISTAGITFDCADARAAATFWSAVVGGAVGDGATSEWASVERAAEAPLSFARVPEAKSAKNRVHLDLSVGDLDAEVARVESLGASVHARFDGPPRWVTMLDPDGNEFCLVAS